MPSNYPHTYKLLKAVSFGSKEIKEINYRDPKGKDLRDLKVGSEANIPMGDLISVFAKMSDQPPQFFDEIEIKDYMNLLGVVSNFLSDGQGTG